MDRIVDDVVDRRRVLLVRLDHLRPVAAPEDVILPSVTLVEGARVGAVQIPHPVGEVRQRRFDEKVVVVAHQAAHVGAPAVTPLDPPQQVEEDDPVAIVYHDRGMVVAPDPDVVVGPGGEVAVRPSHLPNVALRQRRSPRCDGFVPRPTRSCHVPGTRLGRRGRRLEGRVSSGRRGLGARPRLWSARGAGATGSSRAPEGACAGTACPYASSPGSVRRLRPGRLPQSAPR
jgi:hypothetical protein